MRGKLSQNMEAVVQRFSVPVEKRRRFDVFRRLIDVETASCVYWCS